MMVYVDKVRLAAALYGAQKNYDAHAAELAPK